MPTATSVSILMSGTETTHFLTVSADSHIAPATRAVLGRIEEQPAAVIGAALAYQDALLI